MQPFFEGGGVTVYHGDCIEVLRGLPDESVDSVVTDPPYGLADEKYVIDAMLRWMAGDREHVPDGRGFMGKNWDRFVPPPAVWDECLRVLKPGGHLLAFAGSRTADLMGLSIRLAGFEIRDSIAWMYACHDDRTEALTARGWVSGRDLRDDDRIASWSPDGTIELVKPTAIQRYPFSGRMVRFRNADVDQLVTPNHRVYRQTSDRMQVAGVRRASWSEWRVDEAAKINRWQRMRLPAAGRHDGPGLGSVDYAALLGWVFAEGGVDATGNGVRVYQSSVNPDRVAEIDALLERLGGAKHYVYGREYRNRPYDAHTWYVSGDLAARVRADLPEPKSPSWALLWAMTEAEKRAFWDAAMKGDGSRDQRAFWQKNRAALEWCQALLACIESRGKIGDDERGVLHWQPSATVELQRRHLADSGEDYAGEVWCVTVPSGAFVVRRNGRVSVSGNSGFPKSLDVSKAIDKAGGVSPRDSARVLSTARVRAGMTREEVAAAIGCTPASVRDWEEGRARVRGAAVEYVTPSPDYRDALADLLGYTADERAVVGAAEDRRGDGTVIGLGHSGVQYGSASTDAARAWDGWGTALKPAFEPVVVARKPLRGTVAANVLAFGTGALNIDGTRVHTAGSEGKAYKVKRLKPGATLAREGGNWRPEDDDAEVYEGTTKDGRWPSNVVLDEVAASALDTQSGTTRSGKLEAHHARAPKEAGILGAYGSAEGERGYGDEGGISRMFPVFRYEPKAPTVERPKAGEVAHPTVKPIALMEWLVRLVTPPGGTVLEPFAGSGTTAEACIREGFQCIAIEREADYLPLILQRLEKPHQQSLFSDLEGESR